MSDAPQSDTGAEAEAKGTPAEVSATEKVNSEQETEDNKTTETESPDEDAKKSSTSEDDKGSEEGKFSFHNKTFDSVDDFIKEANSVLGQNANLAGDLTDAQEQVESLQDQLQQALEANKKWQEYYDSDGKGEKPLGDKNAIKEALRELEAEKEQFKRQEEITKEFEKVAQQPDYDIVIPEMKNIAKEKGKDFTNKLTPTELYNMAKFRLGLLTKGDTEKLKKDIEKKIVLQKSASSQIGGNARKSATSSSEMDPVVADYFKQILP